MRRRLDRLDTVSRGLERFSDRGFRDRVRFRAQRVVARRQEIFDVGEAERAHQTERLVGGLFELALYLIGRAEEMRVVLREAAHARQTVQRSAAFEAIHGSEFGVADR